MYKGSTGQSLLEIVVSIGLVVVVTTGLAITLVNGLRNSQFSQNQVQATKLAQEGLEQVKAIKERNCPVFVSVVGGGVQAKKWSNDPNLIWDEDFPDQELPTANRIFMASLVPECKLVETTQVESLLGKFSRQIIIIDNIINGARDSVSKKIISEVSWTDVSGTHKSQLITELHSY